MANNAHRHHPAFLMYLLTIVLLTLTVVLGFIAVFVPWVMKDLDVGVRAYAYPFKTCIEETFSPVNKETCMDNDFIVGKEGVPLTGGNSTCKAFVLSTIAFVFISVIGGVLLLLMLLVVLERLWSRPVCLANFAQICLILICIACFLAWIMFICYAEKTCAPNSIFPVQGYSYGFILYIFATALSIGSVVTGFLGLSKLKNYQPLEDKALESDGPSSPASPASGMYPADYDYPVYNDAEAVPTPEAGPAPVYNGPAVYY